MAVENDVAGGGNDYGSLTLWESGEQGDMSDANVAYYYGGTTENFTINGWTSNSASNTISIVGSSSHSGVPGGGVKLTNGASGDYAITVYEGWTIIEDIEIDCNCTTTTTNNGGVRFQLYDGGSWGKAHKLIIHNFDYRFALWVNNSGQVYTVYFYNNIVFDGTNTAATAAINMNDAGTTLIAYNNTVINTDGNCFLNSAGTTVAKNNIAQNSGGTDCYSGSFDAASDYNISSDTSDTGGGNDQNSVSLTFENAGSNNYHLASGDTDAIEAGEDLQPDTDGHLNITVDIDGGSRDLSVPDIGADEYGVAGGGSSGLNLFGEDIDQFGEDVKPFGIG